VFPVTGSYLTEAYINLASHHKAAWDTGGVAPHILDHGTGKWL
jgi:hypothetical protein